MLGYFWANMAALLTVASVVRWPSLVPVTVRYLVEIVCTLALRDLTSTTKPKSGACVLSLAKNPDGLHPLSKLTWKNLDLNINHDTMTKHQV